MALDRDRAEASYRAWRETVEAGLPPTATGPLTIEPLYVDGHAEGLPPRGWPGLAPFVRGASAHPGWLHCQRYQASDWVALSESMRCDLSGGTRGAWLCFDRATRLGRGPGDAGWVGDVGAGGLPLEGAHALRQVVATRPQALILEAGAQALPVAATVLAALEGEGIPASELDLFWGSDPIGALVLDGETGVSWADAEAEMAALATHCHEHLPRARALTVSTIAHHQAGADSTLELGYAAATLVEYLRALERGGVSPMIAASQTALCFAVGQDVFVEIAKLRAARLLWSKVLTACGIGTCPAPYTFAVTSPRALTRRDPYNNLLRGTTQTFAAILGGASAIATTPFDAAIGEPDAFGRRMAQNTQLVLERESYLGQVIDAGGGSHYVERLTEELAMAAWAHLQRIERAGGMRKHVVSGHLAEELEEAWLAQSRSVSRRKVGITGVSEFAAVDEARLERTPYREEGRVDAATERARARDAAWQATAGVAGSARAVGPLVALASRGAPPWALRRALGGGGESPISKRPSLHRDAERFEALRDRADALGTGERRPAVMLAKLGPPAEHKARETFARGFFAAGGIRCTGAPGRSDAAAASAHAEAFRESGAHLACLCGSDPRYALEASDVARALTKAGATRVLLAGRPGEHEQAWRVAGITGFIHLGIDVTETLSELLDVEAEVRGREARDP